MTFEPWYMRAGCINVPTRLFDPVHGGETDTAREKRVELAARVCRSCPVTAECLRAGRAKRESGVWGGLLLEDGRVRRKPAPVDLSRESQLVYTRTVPEGRTH